MRCVMSRVAKYVPEDSFNGARILMLLDENWDNSKISELVTTNAYSKSGGKEVVIADGSVTIIPVFILEGGREVTLGSMSHSECFIGIGGDTGNPIDIYELTPMQAISTNLKTYVTQDLLNLLCRKESCREPRVVEHRQLTEAGARCVLTFTLQVSTTLDQLKVIIEDLHKKQSDVNEGAVKPQYIIVELKDVFAVANDAKKEITDLYKNTTREITISNNHVFTNLGFKKAGDAPKNPVNTSKALQEYTFDNLQILMLNIIAANNISLDCDIFEESFLKMAGVKIQPLQCGFGLDKFSSNSCYIRLNLPVSQEDRQVVAKQLTEYYSQHYGENFIQLEQEDSFSEDFNMMLHIDLKLLIDKFMVDFANYFQNMPESTKNMYANICNYIEENGESISTAAYLFWQQCGIADCKRDSTRQLAQLFVEMVATHTNSSKKIPQDLALSYKAGRVSIESEDFGIGGYLSVTEVAEFFQSHFPGINAGGEEGMEGMACVSLDAAVVVDQVLPVIKGLKNLPSQQEHYTSPEISVARC